MKNLLYILNNKKTLPKKKLSKLYSTAKTAKNVFITTDSAESSRMFRLINSIKKFRGI